jgi:uncharacterized HAD superfamily protein
MNLNLYARSLAGLRLGIDIDGVLYDFCLEFYRFAKYRSRMVIRLGLSVPDAFTAPRIWGFYEDWGWTLENFLEVYREAVNHGSIYTTGQPLRGAALGMRRLHAAGAELFVITDRSVGDRELSVAQTASWLSGYELPYSRLIVERHKDLAYAEHDISVGVDDAPHHWQELTLSGARVLVPRALYNQHCEGAEFVAGFTGFVDLVFTEYGRLSAA